MKALSKSRFKQDFKAIAQDILNKDIFDII